MQKPSHKQIELLKADEVRHFTEVVFEMYSEASEELPGRIACLTLGKHDVAEIEEIILREMRTVDEMVAAEVEMRFGTLT